jgi:hypothetical protein
MFTTTIKLILSTMTIGSTAIINGRTVTRIEFGRFIVRDADRPRLAGYRLDADAALDAIED